MAKQSDKHDVMISYSWANKDIARKIRYHLRRAGLTCWFDETHMHGSLVSAMAKAVENCSIFLMCYSTDYYKSKSCRQEASYAAQRSKIIIPCKLEPDYEPEDWLGFIIEAKLYFDFSGRYSFEKKIEELIREIKIHLEMESPCEPVDEGLITRSKTQDFCTKWFNTVAKLEASLHKKVDDMELDDWVAFFRKLKNKKNKKHSFLPGGF